MLHVLLPLLAVLLTTDAEFTALAVDGSHVYVGTADGEVHSSDDGGETWTVRTVTAPRSTPLRSQLRWQLSVDTPLLPDAYADGIDWPQVGFPRYIRVHETWDPGDGFATSSNIDPTGISTGAGPREWGTMAERSFTPESIDVSSGIPGRLHSALLNRSNSVDRLWVRDGVVFAKHGEHVSMSRDHGATWQVGSGTVRPAGRARGIIEGQMVVAEIDDFAATRHDLWTKTADGWSVRWFGPRHDEIVDIAETSGVVYVLMDRSLQHITSPAPWELRPESLDRLRRETAGEPTLDVLVYEGLRDGGLLPRQLSSKKKVRASHFLPQLRADVSKRDWTAGIEQYNLQFGGINADGSFPLGLEARGPYEDLHWSVVGLWDVQSLIFHPAELPSSVDEANHEFAESLRDQITTLYTERRRLLIARIEDTTGSVRGAALRDVRIEELTEELNLLTNRLFDRYAEGERVEAWPKP